MNDEISSELEELAAGLGEAEPVKDPKVTPAHSNRGGLRNFGQMLDPKFVPLWEQMQAFKDSPPGSEERRAFDAVQAEAATRGLA